MSDWNLYLRLLRIARPYWAFLVILFLVNLLGVPFALLGPVPLKLAIDSILGTQPLPAFLDPIVPDGIQESKEALLLAVVIFALGLGLCGKLRSIIGAYIRAYTRERMMLDFRTELFRNAQRLSLMYHDSRGTSDSVYRIQRDAAALQYVAIDGLFPLVTKSLTLIGMLYISLRIDWQITLVFLLASPVLFSVAAYYKPRLRKFSHQINEVQSSVMAVLHETLGSLRVVKAFGAESHEEKRFTSRANRAIGLRLRMLRHSSALGFITTIATALAGAGVLYLGISHVLAGVLTLGNLLLLRQYLSQLQAPLKSMAKQYAKFQVHLANAERAFVLLDTEPEVQERPDARSLERAVGTISFDGVSFRYRDDHPVLSHLSFAVEAGTRVGIAGPTGVGKSTVVNLLARFYDPTEGTIFLDGADVREYKLADLRRQLGIVLQDPVLFSTTIGDNIAYGRPGASTDDIIEAAKAANAHDFIMSLPDQYETQVGERGMQLSGGERQRVSLARAFLKDAPILVLDEPTSSVDMKTEAGIMEATERLMEGRTVFMIAHRLTTLNNCDMLIVMHKDQAPSITRDVSEAVGQALAEDGFPSHPQGGIPGATQ
jgi:ATP-binding cassette subfamily B protein